MLFVVKSFCDLVPDGIAVEVNVYVCKRQFGDIDFWRSSLSICGGVAVLDGIINVWH